MGRGGHDEAQSRSLLYGSPRGVRRPLGLRARRWAELNPVDYSRQIAFLEIKNGAYERLARILEEKAGAEHDCVRDGAAEVVLDKVVSTDDGEVAVDYTLSPLGDEEIDDDLEHALLIPPRELLEQEILELALPQLEQRHREGTIVLPD